MVRKQLPAVALAVLAASLALVLGAGSAHAQPPPPYMGDYDLNHDQQFSALDVGYFLACWRLYKAGNPLTTPVTFGGWTGTVADGDFNHDGKIDHLDAKMIVEEWILPFPHVHPTSVTTAKVSTAAATVKTGEVSTTSATAPSDAVAPLSSSANLNSTTVVP